MSARGSLESAIVRFRDMASELGRFMSDSEKVFLAAGASLQKLEGEASRVLLASSSRARIGAGDCEPTESLRKGLGDLDDHLEKSKADTDDGVRALTEVLSGVEKLSRLDGEFQIIVATLHALASTTHLENSRRHTEQGSFDSVVTDLRAMAREIKPKFGEVLAQGRELRMTAESALGRARVFLDRHRREVTAFRRDTRTQLAAMTETCRISQTLADKSTESMGSVRADVGTVLHALQVQDLARQMLEHVVEDLQEFATSAQAIIDADPPVDELRAWLAELAVVSRLQSAQLANACDRMVEGLSKIDDSLRGIVSSLTMLAQRTGSYSGKRTWSSLFAQLERGIRATTESLRAHDVQADAVGKALAAVRGTAARVQALVEEVARLGEDARFIGLNAMVKAVRVGHAGATLTVLAREVQTVSDQIQAFTSSATSIMESVAQEAGRLATSGADGGLVQARQVDVTARLEALVGDLGSYQSSLDAAVDMLLSSSATLREEVDGRGRALHALVEQAKALRRLSYELSTVHTSAVADARGAAPPPGRVHNESRRHTMEAERNVHRMALGGPAAGGPEKNAEPADVQAAEGSVEFF